MNRIGIRLLVIVAVVGTIGCDRVTKHIAAGSLGPSVARSLFADTLRLEYAENSGAFLNLGSDWPPAVRTAIFTVGNTAVIAALCLLATRRRWSKPALVGVALFLSGAASNVADRVAYGRVIDFLNVGIGPVRTGIFNVADVAIVAGAAMVASELYRSSSTLAGTAQRR